MRFLIFSFCILSAFLNQAQVDGYVDLSNPRNAIRTHLGNLQVESYNDSLAAQPFNPGIRSLKQARNLAIKLKRVLDGRGIYLYMDEIPTSPNYYDSTSRRHKYIITEEEPRIFLLKNEDGNWYYSDSSVDAINQAYEDTFRFGSGQLLELLPKLGDQKVLGLYVFQYIAIFVLAFFIAFIYRIFSFLTERIFRGILRRAGYGGVTSERFLWSVARPASVFVIILLLLLFIPVLQLPPTYSRYIFVALRVGLPLFGTVIVYRMVNMLAEYMSRVAKSTEGTLDDQLVPLLRKTLKTFVIIIGTLFILNNLNVDIIPLLTGLSIGGLAFALAAQDTIKNFFGSVMIFIDKPFQVGDWVTAGDMDGTVEEVGFRSSRIRTFRNSLIYVPNGRLADSTIDNHGKRKYRRFYTQIAITYDTPPALVQTFVDGLRKIVLEHPDTVKENFHVYLNDMASSSLNVMFYIFFEVPNWGEELRARHEVLLQIMKLAEDLGVNFAFPTQTLHIENLPGQPSLSPIYMQEEEAEKRLQRFFKK